MESDAFTLYKLIILFILDKVDFPLTNAQISDIILNLNYTNYFNIQYSVSELLDAEFINSEKIGTKTYYRISNLGQETLSFFDNMISPAIQEELSKYLKEHQYSLRDEVSTLSEYFEGRENNYIVRLRVVEQNEPIIDLNISVPSEEDAINICNNWSEKSQQIYAYILTNLL
ncbi:MAG: DUF4364 family protein [Clostridiales bacterium]|nr:DUF4364 family protein [Clostridiales bacterium]